MNPKQITKKMMDFNKTVFDQTFQLMTILHDHNENIVFRFLERAQILPEDSKKPVNEWNRIYKKNRECFKDSIDKNYKKIADYLTEEENEEVQKPS